MTVEAFQAPELSLRWAVCTSSRLWDPESAEWAFLLTLLDPAAQKEARAGSIPPSCRSGPGPRPPAAQVAAYRTRGDQKRALVGRLLVRSCIHRALGLRWGQFEVKRTRGKKPFVATEHMRKLEAPNFNFNIAHEVPGRPRGQ